MLVGITMRPRTFFSGNVMTGLVETAAFFAPRYAAFVSGLNVTRTAGGFAAEVLSSNASSRPTPFIKILD
ncbi:hypothetical protein GCM10022409_34190 [Hymenobacter glaciei]|uniref:Uncharacterized protein n=1 Tax=Hymenobacter glaciei TaxID=877209 RepID=A0ABP7UJP4_9BACT